MRKCVASKRAEILDMVLRLPAGSPLFAAVDLPCEYGRRVTPKAQQSAHLGLMLQTVSMDRWMTRILTMQT